MALWSELKRRNVFRVAAAYAVVAWLLVQAGDILLGNFGAPDWVFKTLAAVLLIGFPLALFLAWAYELTPEGVRRDTGDGDSSGGGVNRVDWLILIGLVAVVAVTVADRFLPIASEEAPAIASQPALEEDPREEDPLAWDRSIAILPFADLSPTGDQGYFSDGIAEELLNALSRVEGLRVAGRTSAFHFRDRTEDLRAIGEALGVTWILEGSVRMSADRVRISAQLINARDGFHLWSETYDGELRDIFDLQERIARAITSELRLILTGGEERIVEAATDDPEAYKLFLQATAIFNRRDRERMLDATALLHEALALDPDFVRARSRLAAIHIVLPAYAAVDMIDHHEQAEGHARRAIEQDDRLAEPHAVLGLLHHSSRDFEEARVSYQHALERDPADVIATFWYAIHLWMVGYLEQAEDYLDRTLEVDPMLPIALLWRAGGHLSAGDPEAAQRQFQRAWDLGLLAAAGGLAKIAELEGRAEEAARMTAIGLGQAFDVPGGVEAAEIIAAGLYGDQASRARAVEVLETYLAGNPEPVHGAVPLMLMRLGQGEQALDAAARGPLINETLFFNDLWVRPYGDPALHADGFAEFARTIGLAAFWDRHGPPDRCTRDGAGNYRCR